MSKKGSTTATAFGLRQMTTVGLLASISIVLGLTGYGFIPLPIAKATIMHIPVIIGAILEGPKVGMMIGLLFGLFSVYQNLTAPSVLSFAFINPLVSVLPRVLIAVLAYCAYKALPIKNEGIKIGVGAAVGSLANTFGVLGMLYVVYAAQYAKATGISEASAAQVIAGVGFMNGIPEAVISVLITVPVVLALRRARGR